MKTSKAMLVVAAALAGIAVAGSALAQHRHFHGGPRVSIGFGFGVPFAAYPYGYPYYYPPYYYPNYYPQPVVVQQPPVYVEQNPPAPAASQPAPAAYWYYCTDSRAYYPYVKECASPWQRVAPQPQPG